MSTGYWWLAYALAGMIVVIAFYKISWKAINAAKDDGADIDEYVEAETTLYFLDQHPGLKAFFAILAWAVWPLLFIGMLYTGIMMGWDEIVWRVKKRWNSAK